MAIAIASYFVGRKMASYEAGKEKGSLQTDVTYIKASIDRIERRLGDDVSRLEGRIDEVGRNAADAQHAATRAEASAKSAHKRLDELKR